MLLATTISPGPIFPGDHNLLAVVGASYAFGYLIAAVANGTPGARAELLRRRLGAVGVAVLGVWWFVDAVLRHKGYPVLPRDNLTLLDAAAAFSLGPLLATTLHLASPLNDAETLQEKVDRRGLYFGVLAGMIAVGFWLHGG